MSSKVDLIQTAVDVHGEVHAVLSEHDEELEIRHGTTTFHTDANIVEIEGADTTHFVDIDEIIRFYKPHDALH